MQRRCLIRSANNSQVGLLLAHDKQRNHNTGTKMQGLSKVLAKDRMNTNTVDHTRKGLVVQLM